MGKGGTRFVGDAISSRAGKRCVVTSKDSRKNMEKFLETGEHPDLEWAKKERAVVIPPLPEFDSSRPFVFLDICVDRKQIGRLVIELFTDLITAPAHHFRNRCLPGSFAGLHQASFHKLFPGYAIFGGKDSRAGEGVKFQHNGKLRSLDKGVVSVSIEGDEIAISLGNALNLDMTHQVVGRVRSGLEVLDEINDLSTKATDDSPISKVFISKCGPTNHLGVYEDLESEIQAKMTPEERAAAEDKTRSEARASMMQAIAAGFGGGPAAKRPRNSAPEEDGGAGPSTLPPSKKLEQEAEAGEPLTGRRLKLSNRFWGEAVEFDSENEYSGMSSSSSLSDEELERRIAEGPFTPRRFL